MLASAHVGIIDLTRWLYDEFAVSLDITTVGRELKGLGYVKLTARPRHHAQNELAMEAVKRLLCRRAGKGQEICPEGHADRDLVPGRSADRPEEQDHAALGQAWDTALGSQRPADQIGLYLRRNLPGARQGRGAGATTETMTLHLAEIALAIAPGARAVILMDQAGWHMTGKLDVPDNIRIIALPAKCPELNPVENIWQLMRDNWLSNRVFTSHDNIVDLCCEAWNKLIDQPWRIMTIGHRKWAGKS
jgi:transposase